ncbi:MAG: NADPH-dependent oxidoreductase [Candidatus Hydrogenedentota bacterium]|uniref:NADPH-dependent FMN reductase n=1 Tax=Sumerlaea chitinivorans TaxID=2250252 RepID=A0A2Z4Y6K4_SUMC1|nr:NADPH-dependent FMN reductase [Candidatus Sumerlaea chitinivorans]RMH29751.1 MAG: NADPH-dependent oxidoreductase [Candidatus Hydrogenedentota bacterium]
MARILGISGSLREGSHAHVLVRLALDAARKAGAEVELLDLREWFLPLFEAHKSYGDHPIVSKVVQKIRDAEGYIVGSPEYHASMSGALKNLFDFVYTELSGKLFGLVIATGGSQGVACADNLRACIHSCHGWTLPYIAAARLADFDEQGNLRNEQVRDRLERIGRDVAIYAPLLWQQFKADQALPPGPTRGFAEWAL